MQPEIQQANNWDVTRHYLLTVTISCSSVCVFGWWGVDGMDGGGATEEAGCCLQPGSL